MDFTIEFSKVNGNIYQNIILTSGVFYKMGEIFVESDLIEKFLFLILCYFIFPGSNI